MPDAIVNQLLGGASLRCVMQPNDAIPTNRPLHDECFELPHIIIDGDHFTGITTRDLVLKPGASWPIVFYYTNYLEMFGSFDPSRVEPLNGKGEPLRMSFSPRKRYKRFNWLLRESGVKVWDSEGDRDVALLRAAVMRAARMRAAFLDEEDIWNIHPVILPQVECDRAAFMLQTAYIAYPGIFREVDDMVAAILGNEESRLCFDEEERCFTQHRGMMAPPFQAFYHLRHDGSYSSYYDLARGNTTNKYQRLVVFAEE
ncbi:MAG: hypothetical protein HQL31_05040 [Planctomycetes bacterium]|nr:hypothetical protein [Planctomycetota bacterium]